MSGDAAGGFENFVNGTFCDDFAAEDTGSGSEVDDVISSAHGFFVVFDDDDGIALVAKPLEAAEEHGVVAGVESDGGFVEDVDDADETAADLSGESNALGFSAGECGSGAFEGEVPESALEEEAESAANFAECFFGDELLYGVEDELFEEFGGIVDGESADLWEAEFLGFSGANEGGAGGADADVAGLFIESFAFAGAAGGDFHVFFELPTAHGVCGGAPGFEESVDPAFPGAAVFPDAAASAPGEGDVSVSGAMEPEFFGGFGDVFPFGFEE